ncbi:acetyl-CoA carboxylase biotin carboxylase subunit [Siminovitchia thermophila]|nr:acetyl-CoA carboxylase biotin carboxylase subunit [Siminovitchia thermophila]
MMLQKVLVANRGEIASRIIRTLKRLNIQSVAVYSEADKDAPFVQMADEAYYIGEPQVQKSYLNVEAIMEAARKANIDAIHPGYGFLSESSDFAMECETNGITFIGPQAGIIQKMGDKLEARNLMKQAGVPVVPGSQKSLQHIGDAKQLAKEIGYPIMLKASAGGGGIGMSVIHCEAELEKHFNPSQKRAEMYFGNGALFIEKWIEHPRHIEVQIACDQKGNALHLYERECSIQRRHQKVVEESPTPALSKEVKENLLRTALKGAKEIGYQNIGTMEFIFDEHMNFYFLEMNTRLQVEHPITEETTGVDLVEMQINIAAGYELDVEQTDIKQHGHAIECRLYAEDPVRFFPSPGMLTTLKLPEHGARFDFGVAEGNVITPFYDPMIGKIITHGGTRAEAIAKMKEVLAKIEITGVKTNLPILIDTMNDSRFTEGMYTTSFLNKENMYR